MMGRIALLLGLFAVPAFLLWAGHHWRHRSNAVRGAFWGGLIAHTAAALLATVAGLYRPAEWAASDLWRGFLGLWSMLVLFAIGAAIGAVVGARSADPVPQSARAARRPSARPASSPTTAEDA
jgi:hypothetical protein